MKVLFTLCMFVSITVFAEETTWQSLEGVYSAKGQDGCSDVMEIYHQTLLGVHHISLFSEHEGIRDKEVDIVEGEWISGPVDSPIYHYGFNIKSPQGNYITYLKENPDHSVDRKVTIRVTASEVNGSVAFFNYYDDKYSLNESLFCIYERTK